MKKLILSLFVLPFILNAKAADQTLLEQEFNFSNARVPKVQLYEMTSELINYALDGKRLGRDIFHFLLNVSNINYVIFLILFY